MTQSLIYALVIFLAVDAVALLLILIYQIRKSILRRRIRHFGDRAEKEVRDYIRKEFPGAVLLSNVFLRTDRSSTQLDHILLCKWGIFVIETKSHNGTIQTEKKNWVQIYGNKVIRFYSPVLQNRTHTQALIRLLRKNRRFRHEPVKGLVVFTSKKVFFSHRPKDVLRLSELAPYIKSGGKVTHSRRPLTADRRFDYLSRERIRELEEYIRKGRIRSRKQKRHHEKTVRYLDQKGARS